MDRHILYRLLDIPSHLWKTQSQAQKDTIQTTKRRRVKQWISEKVNTVVFTLYGESDERLTAFLKKESIFGVSESGNPWRDTQLIWLVVMIKINALTLLLTSALALRDRFLVERSVVYDEEKICFYETTDTGRGWLRAPITNCSTVNGTEQIICFEFVYSVVPVVGLLGDVLTYGIYLVNFSTSC